MPVVQTLPARGRRGRHERGVMLIEALIAILIFSIGILGIIGLQASAVQQSTDAKNRAEAAFLADQLMGRMWSGSRAGATLKDEYDSANCGTCTGWKAWFAEVKKVLPGVTDADNKPSVVVNEVTGKITVTLYWRAPGDDPASAAHNYNVEAQIGQ